MKRTLIIFTLFIIVFNARSQPGPYMEVVFFSVAPENRREYVALEREIWKPIHEARIKAGELSEWYCFAVGYSANNTYDFVVVNVYKDLKTLDKEVNMGEWFKKIHPSLTAEQIQQKTLSARKEVRSELQRKAMGITTAATTAKPSAVFVVNYFKSKSGKSSDYQKRVTEIYQPYIKRLASDNKIREWDFNEVWFPNGLAAQYDYVGMRGYNGLADLDETVNSFDYKGVFKSVHPTMEFDAFRKSLEEMRDQYASEIWWLVDYAR